MASLGFVNPVSAKEDAGNTSNSEYNSISTKNIKKISNLQSDGNGGIFVVAVEKREQDVVKTDYFIALAQLSENQYRIKETTEEIYKSLLNNEDSFITTQEAEDLVYTKGIDAINKGHISIDYTGYCSEFGTDSHHKLTMSIDFKEKINDMGLTAAGAVVSLFLDTKAKIKALVVLSGYGLAMVTRHSDVSWVYREADNGPGGIPVTHSYVTGGYKDYDWKNMSQWTDITGHVVPKSLP